MSRALPTKQQVTPSNKQKSQESHKCLNEKRKKIECMFLMHVLQAILNEHQLHKLVHNKLCAFFSPFLTLRLALCLFKCNTNCTQQTMYLTTIKQLKLHLPHQVVGGQAYGMQCVCVRMFGFYMKLSKSIVHICWLV